MPSLRIPAKIATKVSVRAPVAEEYELRAVEVRVPECEAIGLQGGLAKWRPAKEAKHPAGGVLESKFVDTSKTFRSTRPRCQRTSCCYAVSITRASDRRSQSTTIALIRSALRRSVSQCRHLNHADRCGTARAARLHSRPSAFGGAAARACAMPRSGSSAHPGRTIAFAAIRAPHWARPSRPAPAARIGSAPVPHAVS